MWVYKRSSDRLSVVYLATGEVYIGKLTTFPRLVLAADGYQFQMAQDQEGGSNVQLIPISDAPWAPERFYLNRDQVVLYGPLSEESLIFKTLLEKSATTTAQ